MNYSLKGHFLLRKAGLDTHTRNIVVGSTSGSYEFDKVSTALRQACRNSPSSAVYVKWCNTEIYMC